MGAGLESVERDVTELRSCAGQQHRCTAVDCMGRLLVSHVFSPVSIHRGRTSSLSPCGSMHAASAGCGIREVAARTRYAFFIVVAVGAETDESL